MSSLQLKLFDYKGELIHRFGYFVSQRDERLSHRRLLQTDSCSFLVEERWNGLHFDVGTNITSIVWKFIKKTSKEQWCRKNSTIVERVDVLDKEFVVVTATEDALAYPSW